TGVRVNDVGGPVLNEVGEAARSGEIEVVAEGQGQTRGRDAAMDALHEGRVGAAGDSNVVAAFDEALDEPARLLFAAAPSALFVEMKNVHGRPLWRAR